MSISSTSKIGSSKKTTHDWPRTIEAWQHSGLSQKAFCREQNIAYSHFKYHCYGSARPSKNNAQSTEKHNIGETPAAFAPIHITESSSEAHTEIRFPSGVVIKVPAQTALLTVMKALSAYL